jgi:hypothetical protein
MEYIGMAEWQRASFRQTQLQGIPAGTVLASTKSVRAWADEYCASEKIMKEFKFRKVRFHIGLRRPSVCGSGAWTV